MNDMARAAVYWPELISPCAEDREDPVLSPVIYDVGNLPASSLHGGPGAQGNRACTGLDVDVASYVLRNGSKLFND